MKKLFTLLFVFMAALSVSAEDYEVEAANIAAFNAIEDGKVVKLTLTNARVNAYDDITPAYYVEDATGATTIKGTSLTVGTLLNGYIVGKKDSKDVDSMHDPSWCIEPSLTVENASLSSFEATATTLVGAPMTITEACTQANHGKLVTLSDITITPIGNGMNKQLEDANGNKMRTRDLFGVLPDGYTWPEHASKMTGLFIYYYTAWFLIPISADAIVPYVQPTEVTFDFENNNLNLAYGHNGTPAEAKAGDLSGKSIEKDGVILNFVSAATIPSRYYLNGDRGLQLQSQSGGQMRVTAPSGYAITQIVSVGNKSVNSKTGAITYQNSWTVNKGGGNLTAANQETQTWTGNAESVRLNSATCYLNALTITLAAVNSETILRTNEVSDEYTEVEGLGAFNNTANNTLVKLLLKDAIITSGMINEEGFYVQDATGGAHFYYTGLEFNINDKLDGYIFVKKSNQTVGARIAMTEETNKDNLEITANGTYEPITGSISDINVATNKLKVVKLANVKVKGLTETTATITDAYENTIAINNAKTNNYPYVIKESLEAINYSNATVVGILFGSSATENKIMPLSITEGNGTGIETIHNSQFTVKNSIYNLQGIRMNSLKKGLNIVNGKKVVVK